MRQQTRELLILSVIVLISLIAHVLASHVLSFGLTGLLLGALLIAWTLKQPLPYLVAMAVIAELTTTIMPGGMLALSVLCPLVLWRLRRRVTVDLSFRYLALIALTVAIQLTIVLIPDIMQQQPQPTFLLVASWVTITFTTFVASIAIMDLLPSPQQSVISLEGYKIHNT